MNEQTQDNFPALLERSRSQLKMALPRHLTPDRFIRIALTAYRKNKKLQQANPMSLLASVMQASQLGLEIGVNGEASLVPFKGDVNLIIGYTGLIKLAYNAGFVKGIFAKEVRELDFFYVEFGTNAHIIHKPFSVQTEGNNFPASEESRGAVVGFYAVATMKEGGKEFDVMPVQEVSQIRDSSQNHKLSKQYGSESVWDKHPVEMGKKTVIRRLCKRIPLSAEMDRALALEDVYYTKGTQGLNNEAAFDAEWTPDTSDEDQPTAYPTVQETLKERVSSKLEGKK